ncbi:MAG TPA: response regulator transcription factor [Bryobacteraceae bacterium]|nr:response regulator transcription factor [Bryobacteraceae bacterium]
MISLFLVDEHTMFREGLSHCLEKEPDFRVAGGFGSCTEALTALRGSEATVVLLDVNVGAESALNLVTTSMENGLGNKFLIVTAGTSRQEAIRLVQAGVTGILHKHRSIVELCSTIRLVAAGEFYLESAYVDSASRSSDRAESKRQSRLTERDRIVLRLLARGLNNREIGEYLKISESGVKSSLRQLFDKMGVRTRVQLVRIALEDLSR